MWSDVAEQTPATAQREIGHPRRLLATIIFAGSVAGLAVSAMSRWNPWRYVHLMPLGSALPWVLVASFVLVGVAALLGLRSRPLSVLATLLAGWAAVVALVIGTVSNLVPNRPSGEVSRVAISSDRAHEVVRFDSGELRIRSRHGLFSREGDEDLACFPLHRASQTVKLATVRFIGTQEIELSGDDGSRWRTSFDPRTLRPDVSGWGCGLDE
jgi:hypothetical protein